MADDEVKEILRELDLEHLIDTFIGKYHCASFTSNHCVSFTSNYCASLY